MTAACVHRLVDRGVLDLERKVSQYWPEFGCNGKEDICVRHLLSPQAGLPAVDGHLPPDAIFEWETMARALADQKPLWQPGTIHGYHARPFGWLLVEIVRRVTGKSLGTYFRDEIAGPLDLDFHIEHARTEQSRGSDQALMVETRFGLGFMMPVPGATMGPNDNAFGHPGMGGIAGIRRSGGTHRLWLRNEFVRIFHSHQRTTYCPRSRII